MGSRLLICRTVCAAAALVMILAFATDARGQQDEKTRLLKRQTELKDQIKKEEEKLSKKKDAIAAEYKKLSDELVIQKIAPSIEKLILELRNALKAQKNDEARASLEKQLRSVLVEAIGPNIGSLVEPELVTTISIKLQENEMPTAAESLRQSIESLEFNRPFDLAYEETIKSDISKPLRKLSEDLASVERQLEDLARAEAAKRAGIPPGMVQVKGGTARIGVDEKELVGLAEKLGHSKQIENMKWTWRATPSHDVKLDDFYIDVNEVTCAWYLAFLKDNSTVKPPKYWKEGKIPAGFENRPVTQVRYIDAVACAKWMGRRLPSEEEWEYAARFGDPSKKDRHYWPWGDTWDLRESFCNSDQYLNSKARLEINPELPPMLPVGSFPKGRNALGMNDLAGNAFEWTTSPFQPYKDFKEKNFGQNNRISAGDFDENQMVIRGGDANKRDVVVTTFNRLGLGPGQDSPFVGFRTVASATRGKDHIAALREDGNLDSWILMYPPLPSDIANNRPKNAAIEFDKPSGYTSLMSGGFDEATNLPCRANHITIASRIANDFRDFSGLKERAREMKDQALMLGYLHLDIPAVEPALEPGDYFVLWQNQHPVTATSESALPMPNFAPSKEAKPSKDEKGAKEEKGKSAPPPPQVGKGLGEAFVFQRRGTKEAVPNVRVEREFAPPVIGPLCPTRIELMRDSNIVVLVYSFPMVNKSDKSFIISLNLKLKEGETQKLH